MKNIKILLISILIFLVLVMLEYAHQGFIQDISMQAAIGEIEEPGGRPPVYLISYVEGKEYFFRNQNAMAHYAINKGIDFILNYRKAHMGKDFYERNKNILSKSPGAGLWLWKPYFIYKTMQEAPEGAIIIYLDAAFIINKPITTLINNLDKHDIVLLHDHDRLNGPYIKGDSFALMGFKNDECRYDPHIASGIMMLKNTKKSRDFIKKWLDLCQNEKLISADYYNIKPNYPEFLWHHYEQSILSLLYCQDQSIAKVMEFDDFKPYFSWFHRKQSKSSPNKQYYTLYGTDPLINFSRNGKSLPSTALLNLPPVVFIRKLLMGY